MKNIIFLLALFISGCSVEANVINRAEHFCKDHQGIDSIQLQYINSWVTCNDGTQKPISTIKISKEQE